MCTHRSARQRHGTPPEAVRRGRRARLGSLAAAGAAVLWAAAAAPGAAGTFVRVADADLAAQAEVVVEGRVRSIDPAAGGRRAETEIRLAVDRVIAARASSGPIGRHVAVRVPGGRLPDGSRVHVFGAPRFAAGERAVFFLTAASPSGARHLLHLAQGAFHVVEAGGRELAVQDFTGSKELPLPGPVPEDREGVRDLGRFREWLADRARGTLRAPDYFVTAPGAAASKFGLIRDPVEGLPVRWQVPEEGGVRFRMHQDGQPGLAGGGSAEVRAALRAWNEVPGIPALTSYDGVSDRTTGGLFADGVNVVLFDDPNDHFNSLFSCASGGTLAATWVRYGEPKHSWNGMEWWTIFEADVVTNQGIACWIGVGRRAEEVFAHEIGHALGLGHACGDARNGPCDVDAVDDALMRSSPHADGRGARLAADDRDGLTQVYGTVDAPPAAPGDLRAELVSGGAVGLRWTDGSDNEVGFEVERSLAGGEGGFERIAAVNGNTPRATDRDVTSGVAYAYRVRAWNGAGVSGYTNEAVAVAGGELAPTDLTATALSSSDIALAWRDNATGEDAYFVQGDSGAGFVPVGTTPRNTESTVLQGLRPSTTYAFRIKALGGAGDSSFSNVASATTLPVAAGSCLPAPMTLCLGGGRFAVTVEWRDFESRRGAARVVPPDGFQPSDSGLFFFFAPGNWELLVKVLDGCAFNGHYWVFAAATTNVEYSLRVTDTASGVSRRYLNPLGSASDATADVEAFATCP